MRKKNQIPRPGSHKSEQSGFTLIELLVGAAIMVLLTGGFVGLQYILSQNQTSAWKSYLSIESANGALANITNELRNAQPSELGSYQLERANDQEIIFYSDYDYDEVVERIRYTLSGTILSRGIVEPSGSPLVYNTATEKIKAVSDIIRNGSSPIFYYYNSDWPTDTTNNPLTQANRISDTRQIKIILSVNSMAGDTENNYILETFAKLRTIVQ